MKKLLLMIAFTGMVVSVSASTFGDDKDKDKKKECAKGDKKECCKKGDKKCCKKDAKVAVVGENPSTPANPATSSK